MNSTQKIFRTLIALGALTVATSALSQQQSLRFIAQSTGTGSSPFDAVIAAFEKNNPDIKVEAEYFPVGEPYIQVLRTRLQGGDPPDLFYVTPGSGGIASVLPLLDAGLVADLSKSSWAADIVPQNARHLYWKNNQLAAVPISQVAVPVIYNIGTFKELGLKPPQNMLEMLSQCERARSKGKSLLGIAGASAQNAGLLASALAVNYVLQKDPLWNTHRFEGKTSFAKSVGWKKVLQNILDFKKNGCFAPGAEGMDNPPVAGMLATGPIASWVVPIGVIGILKSINPKVQLGTFPMPGPTSSATAIYASPSDAIALAKGSKNPAAAQKFLDYFATGNASDLYAAKTGNISTRQAASGENLAPELAGIASILKAKKTYPLIQLEWKNPQVYTVLGESIQGLLTGQLGVDEILKKLDAAWDRK